MSLAQGLTRPLTPAGLATFRLVGASLARVAGTPLDDPRSGPAALHVIGQRLFLDLTPVITNRLGRRLALVALGVMEKRSATVLEAFADDPRFAVVDRSPRPVIRGILRVVVLRAKMPLRALTAVVAPASVPGRIAGLERKIRTQLTLPGNATPERRLDLIEREVENGLFLIMPTAFAYPATGLILLNRARRLVGDLARPDEWQTVLRGLPHNVTTEMDLELWAADRAGARRRGIGGDVRIGLGRRADRPLSQPHPAGRRPARHHRVPAPLRSSRGGRDRPRYAALVRRPGPHRRGDRQLPAARRSGARPGRVSSPAGRPRRRSCSATWWPGSPRTARSRRGSWPSRCGGPGS